MVISGCCVKVLPELMKNIRAYEKQIIYTTQQTLLLHRRVHACIYIYIYCVCVCARSRMRVYVVRIGNMHQILLSSLPNLTVGKNGGKSHSVFQRTINSQELHYISFNKSMDVLLYLFFIDSMHARAHTHTHLNICK